MAKPNIRTYQTKKNITIKVDRSKCISCGTCVALAPNTFELDKDLISIVKEDSEDDLETVKQAVLSCPSQALTIETKAGKI